MEDQQGPLQDQLQATLPSPPATFIERYGLSPAIFALFALIVVFVLYQIVGGLIAWLIFRENPTAENVVGYRLVTGLGQLAFMLVPALLMARLASTAPRDYLRFRTPDVRAILLSIVGILSLQQVLQIYLVLQEKIPVPSALESLLREYRHLLEEAYRVIVSSQSIPELITVIAIIALIPAIAEETLFRGLVQRSLERGLTPTWGVVLTGSIFGLYHLNPSSLIPLVALGIYLGFLAMRANSLWVSVVAHFVNNASACIAVYLQQDDDAIITGNPKEMSAAMLLGTFLFFAMLFLASVHYFLRVTDDRTGQPDSVAN